MFDNITSSADKLLSTAEKATDVAGKVIEEGPEALIDFETFQASNKNQRRIIETTSPRGFSGQSIANAFMGFNHRMAISPIPKNREMNGLTFFTRPDFNLNEANLRSSRRFNEMMMSPTNSLDYSIIAALDPLNKIVSADSGSVKLGTPLLEGVKFDNRQAFIPLLTNTLLSMSGFPDNTLDVYTSEEGLRREQWSMVDSIYEVNYTFSLSSTFRNIDGDPITKMLTTWLEYMAAVYNGDMLARVSNRIQRRKDYETAIYRFLTDPTGRFITKYGRTIAFPVNDNIGALMNFDATSPFVSDNDQINIQFHAQGAEYNDPAIISDFNDVVRMFNPDMIPTPGKDTYVPLGHSNLVRVTRQDLEFFNWYGYPYIDPVTKELFWYVSIEDYDNVMKEVNNNG